MALIECPKCGASISDKATACPKCGHKRKPEKAQEEQPVRKAASAPPVPQNNLQGQKPSWVVWVIASCLLIAGAVASVVLTYPSSEESEADIDSMQMNFCEDNVQTEIAVNFSQVFPSNSTLLKQDKSWAYAIVGNPNEADAWRIVKYNAETQSTDTIPLDYDFYWQICDYRAIENGILLRLEVLSSDICVLHKLIFVSTPSSNIIDVVGGCGDVQYDSSSLTTCKYFELNTDYEYLCDRGIDSITFTLNYTELGYKDIEKELYNTISERQRSFKKSQQY